MKDAHTEHCCAKHGCKYGKDDVCTVVAKGVPQSYPCEYCEMDKEVMSEAALACSDEIAELRASNDRLRSALLTLLDQVDYTAGACGLTEMVGACLDAKIIGLARAALSAKDQS